MFLDTGSSGARRLIVVFLLGSLSLGAFSAGLEARATSSIVAVPASVVDVIQSPAPTSSQITAEKAVKPAHIAHHESGGIGVSSLLTGSVNSHEKGSLTKSLWTNLILSMAYQQDEKLKAIDKKLHRFGALAFGSIAAISGLALAQGIDGFITLQDEPHPLHPPIMGLIGSGLTLVTIGSQAVMGHRYKKQMEERQHEIQHEVLEVLTLLKADGATELVQANLSTLIGEEAKDEFLELWKATHDHH